MKHFSLILLTLGLVGCVHGQQTKQSLPQQKPQDVTLSHFSRIDASGPVRLQVVGTEGRQDAIRYARNKNITVRLKGETLFINAKKAKDGKNKHAKFETVKLLSTDLQAVHLSHWSSARLENIHSRKGLTVIDESRSDLTMRGDIILKKLIKHYPGTVHIDWVDSDCLAIEATQGHIYLAGVAKQMYVRLSGGAQADLKYLRAHRVWVRTRKHSHAAILPLQSLNAFADDDSLIDYYKRPKQLIVHSHEQGRIMQVAAWR